MHKNRALPFATIFHRSRGILRNFCASFSPIKKGSEDRRSLAIWSARQSHILGPHKLEQPASGKIAATTAEVRGIAVHSASEGFLESPECFGASRSRICERPFCSKEPFFQCALRAEHILPAIDNYFKVLACSVSQAIGQKAR